MDLQRRRQEVERIRREKDRFFQGASQSPIPPEEREGFQGLAYYPYDEGLVLEVALQEAEAAEEAVLATSVKGHETLYRKVGFFEVPVAGEKGRLHAYRPVRAHAHGPPTLFVPFRDATSGKETYGAGRYLDLEGSPSGRYVLDFNEAYNPYCAYSDAYVCPLPPKENWLDLPIRAGEQAYGRH